MPKQTRERQGDRSLLDICLCVHMGTTGSADPEPKEYVEILEDALKNWEPNTFSSSWGFDEAVRHLIWTTLCERRRCEYESGLRNSGRVTVKND